MESLLAVLGLIVQNSSGPALQAVVGSDIVTELFVCNLKKGTAQSRAAASMLLVGIAQKVWTWQHHHLLAIAYAQTIITFAPSISP